MMSTGLSQNESHSHRQSQSQSGGGISTWTNTGYFSSIAHKLSEGMQSKGDVVFRVGRISDIEEEVKASSFILSLLSPVFQQMFECSSPTCQQHKLIKLTDVSPRVFKIFLKLLVTEDLSMDNIKGLNLPDWDIFHLLHLGKKYDIPRLRSSCRWTVLHYLKTDSSRVASIYNSARSYKENGVETEALELIAENAADVFKTTLNFTRDSFTKILERDDLQIDEASLFLGVCRWAEMTCSHKQDTMTGEQIRKALGDIIFLIRFPLMSAAELAKFVRPRNILTQEEMLDLYDFIALSPEERKSMKKKKIPFSNIPRAWKGPEEVEEEEEDKEDDEDDFVVQKDEESEPEETEEETEDEEELDFPDVKSKSRYSGVVTRKRSRSTPEVKPQTTSKKSRRRR